MWFIVVFLLWCSLYLLLGRTYTTPIAFEFYFKGPSSSFGLAIPYSIWEYQNFPLNTNPRWSQPTWSTTMLISTHSARTMPSNHQITLDPQSHPKKWTTVIEMWDQEVMFCQEREKMRQWRKGKRQTFVGENKKILFGFRILLQYHHKFTMVL